jgi:flagellar FliL protein
MSEKKTTQDSDGNEAKPDGGRMGLIILAGAAIMTSFGASYFLSPAEKKPVEAACVAEEPVQASAPKRMDQSFVQMEEILITIGSEPATRYLKMEIAVVTDKSHVDDVKKDVPILMDAFVNYLRSVEITDFENPAYFGQMREQLSRRSELVLGASVSEGILVTSFLLR